MIVVAIAAIPSIDISRVVGLLNQSDRCLVTNEARTFAYWYHVSRRVVADPWLLHPHMAGLVTETLDNAGAGLLTELYRSIGGGGASLSVWGDAHAHYLDPLDKPGFPDFFLKSFRSGVLITVLDEPWRCVARLIARGWVPSATEAVDVVARHIAQAESVADRYPGSAFQLDLRRSDLKDALRELAVRLGIAADLDLETFMRSPDEPDPQVEPMEPLAEVEAMFNDRLAVWRHELRKS
jgi:hypothetical protein